MSHGLYADQHSFEELASSLLTDERTCSFGKLHVITIGQNQSEDTWSAIWDKAERIADSILHQRLGRTDACLEIKPGQYLLLFPGLSEEEGIIKATAIGREIRERLFGQTLATLEVKVQMMPLARLKGRERVAKAETMHHVLDSHDKQAGIHFDVLFQPLWSPRRQEIIGNLARIRRVFGDRELFGRAILFGGDSDPLALEANACLRRAAARISHPCGMLVLPQFINEHALKDSGEMAVDLHSLAKTLPGTLVVELSGDIVSLPRVALRGLVGMAREAGARVAVRSIPDAESAHMFKSNGIDFISVNEADIRALGLTPSATHALFTVAAHEVRGSGLDIWLWNAIAPQDIKRAANLGFALFSGPPVGEQKSVPASPHSLPANQIFRGG